MSNKRTGKIASLPFELRTSVNKMIRDGAKYSAIIKFLEQHEVHVNEQNLTNWHQGGHLDWLREQERLQEMALKREFALDIAKQNEGSKIHEAGLQLAASQIFELLNEFDVETLKSTLSEDPENYSRIVTALARISKEALGIEKYRALVLEQKQKIEAALSLAKNKGGITPDTLAEIERAAAML